MVTINERWTRDEAPLATKSEVLISLMLVTAEWLLGIGLIVTFALLVKGARFGFIRDLLGI